MRGPRAEGTNVLRLRRSLCPRRAYETEGHWFESSRARSPGRAQSPMDIGIAHDPLAKLVNRRKRSRSTNRMDIGGPTIAQQPRGNEMEKGIARGIGAVNTIAQPG